MGPVPFTHAQETSLTFTLGLTNMTIFASVIAFSFIGPLLMEAIGTVGVFIFFGCTSAIGVLFSALVIRNSTYKYIEEDAADIFRVQDSSLPAKNSGKKVKKRVLLSQREKLELYFPEKYKTNEI
jgi:hypothetical protein